MKFIFLLLNLAIFTSVYAQKVTLSGTVVSNNIPLENVNIVNFSTSEVTNSKTNGAFSLTINMGDSLKISYLGMETILRVINQRELENPKQTFNMVVVSSKLDEVKINTIDAISLGIFQKE